ncbi:MAG TPA: DUF192 domain-containing protein [Burkholderiaceae bacterium]|jgi:hypothetical protein
MILLSIRRLAAWSLALASAAAAAQTDQPQQLPTIRLTTGMHVLQVQVAQTPQQQEIGLMFRQAMGTNEGMLFVFDAPRQQCFWMKNTILPLSVAFIADDGTVVNVDDMKPQTLDNHCSTKPVRYVLEMNVGWYARSGVKAGSRFGGEPFAK